MSVVGCRKCLRFEMLSTDTSFGNLGSFYVQLILNEGKDDF